MKLYIPNQEIEVTDLHLDELGFVFLWRGHLLRGIYPESVALAKEFLENGFIDEAVSKGLFPRTWITDYTNENFGLILEHELISPIIYATEWNFYMLRDAACMVLNIAELAHKYGYNMCDCHKKNVLFKNNRPIYVDLGSFVRNKKGCNVWYPYSSFLKSYYYILDIWRSGAHQIAKRMMSPGVELNIEDYYVYKYPIFRYNKSLLSFFLKGKILLYSIAGNDVSTEMCASRLRWVTKKVVEFFKISKSQWRLNSIKKKISKFKIRDMMSDLQERQYPIISLIGDYLSNNSIESVCFIDIEDIIGKKEIIDKYDTIKYMSINQNAEFSGKEYLMMGVKNNFTSLSYQLLNGNIMVRNFFPDYRLTTDIVVATIKDEKNKFSGHNQKLYLKECFRLSKVILLMCTIVPEWLAEEFVCEHISNKNGYVCVVLKEK